MSCSSRKAWISRSDQNFKKKASGGRSPRDRACLAPDARSSRLAHSASPQRGERLGSSDWLARPARPARLGAAVVCHIAPGQAQNTCPIGAKEKKEAISCSVARVAAPQTSSALVRLLGLAHRASLVHPRNSAEMVSTSERADRPKFV
jgi:hypothetical protein